MSQNSCRSIQKRRFSLRTWQSIFASGPARQGTTAVEFAMVSPVVFLFVFAGIEFGRLQMVCHGLEAAAREGCRTAVSWKASEADVQQTVTNRLSSFGIVGHSLTTLPTPLSGAREWDAITVRVEVAYGQASWLPTPRFLGAVTLSGSCTMPKEAVDAGS